MRWTDQGLFWHDVPASRKRGERQIGPMPEIPETGWLPPTEFPNLSAAKVIGFDTETKDPELLTSGPGWARGRGHIIGISIAVPGKAWYFPIRHEVQPELNMDAAQVLRYIGHVLGDDRPKVGANLMYDVGWLQQEGVRVGGKLFDIQFAEPLLDSETPDVSLDGLAQRYLGVGKTTSILYDWLAQWLGGAANDRQRANLYRSPVTLAGPYAEADAALPIDILGQQWAAMDRRGVLDLFDLECRLIRPLVGMRFRGAPVDLAKAEEAYDRLGQEAEVIERQLKEMAGQPVNPAARESIKAAFTKLGIPHPIAKDKKTKEEKVSFSADLLELVDHPLAEKIVEHRQLLKVRNTFIKSYLLDKHVNGRIHCSFHPLKSEKKGARSGRFSCVEANTPLLTSRGYVAIKDIVVGDKVWTHRNRFRKIIATYIKPADAMYRVSFSNGQEITCTAGHRFMTPEGWRTLDEICTRNSKMGYGPSRPNRLGFGSIPESRNADEAAGHQSIQKDPWALPAGWHVQDHYDELHARGGMESPQIPPLQRKQRGGEEPHVRENLGETPQLRRGSTNGGRGGPRVLYEASPGPRLHTKEPFGNVPNAGYPSEELILSRTGCSSYRRGQHKGRTGQLGVVHSRGAWGDSWEPEGQQILTIEEINPCGSLPVYDVTVEEDESYSACGVFNHNSSDPNLQNIPVRTELGGLVREAFVARPGARWVKLDYSQIEYRLLAHHAVGPGAEELRRAYSENPDVDYHELTQELVLKLTGMDLPRRNIKTINFGLIYGMSQPELAKRLHLDKKGGGNLFDSYHRAAPFARATMEAAAEEVHKTGYVETVLGRKSDFPLWAPRNAYGVPGLPYGQAILEYGPAINRAFTHKALNRKLQGGAADVMKKALVDAYEAGLFADDACGTPMLTVHDELDFEDEGDPDSPAWAELKRVMETCLPLKIPVRVDMGVGPNWKDAD